jgi:hypothetical protein
MKPKLATGLFMLLIIVFFALPHRHGNSAAALRAKSAAPPPPPARDSWLAVPRPASVHTEESLAEAVDRLVASRRPSDAYEAYEMVQDCMDFMRTGRLAVPDGANDLRDATADEMKAETIHCAGMTERMKTERLVYLETAARAGVLGADLAFMRVGPFGDPTALQTRPDDALVVEWKKQALAQMEAQAAAGNVGSVMALMTEYQIRPEVWGRNPAQLLRYGTAMHDVFQQMFGDTEPSYSNPLSEDVLKVMGQGLSAEQFAAAQAAGHEIAARAVEPRKSAMQP